MLLKVFLVGGGGRDHRILEETESALTSPVVIVMTVPESWGVDEGCLPQ